MFVETNLHDPMTSLTASAFVVWAMQWLKKSKLFPLITTETAKLNRIVAVIMSGLATLGVHATFDHTNGTLTITGLTAAAILAGLWEWLKSFAVQEVVYQSVVNKPSAPPA